jgi:hypothetical protein
MNAKHGPYHRHGGPGGPGCPVSTIPITLKTPEGSDLPAELLDAGPTVTELELLRTIAERLDIRWGHDDSGWWAAVPTTRE